MHLFSVNFHLKWMRYALGLLHKNAVVLVYMELLGVHLGSVTQLQSLTQMLIAGISVWLVSSKMFLTWFWKWQETSNLYQVRSRLVIRVWLEKHTRNHSIRILKLSKVAGKIVYTEVARPLPASIEGHCYSFIFLDQHSRSVHVACLQSKK